MTNEQMKDIYWTLMGQLIPGAEVPGIPNAFAPGTKCDSLLTEIYAARNRLLDRLGIREDGDLETIVSGYEEMLELIGMEMLRIGLEWQEK